MVMKNSEQLKQFKDLLSKCEQILYATSRLPYLPEITFKEATHSE